ncbi:tetratricopeptide repeat protein [Flavobacterium psychrophilum]|nr:tetratricopeptide repeat protein [Flavobacterium psychrophilum]
MDSRTVFELRREGKIQEALNMALQLYQIDPDDAWNQSALAWPLIDLCKAALTQNNLSEAQKYFNQLIAIKFTSVDDIVTSQISFLRPKIDINYTKIQEAENLSKTGNHKQALSNMKAMFANNQLLDIHHEAFGWIIYRYIKAEEKNVTSVEIRSLMRDYMNLSNERPSMLHSTFLNFALNFSKEHSDFNLYSFFLLWEPKNLRLEDVSENYKDGKTYSSLISRIFKEFIDKKVQLDSKILFEKIPFLSPVKIIELLREPYYWNIYTADKENRKEVVWKIFEEYNALFKNQKGSEIHSKILNSAMFSMRENEEWRFLNFFENWNPENFIESDWKEIVKEDKVYPPLAIKALKKAFEQIKLGNQFNDLTKLIIAYKTAIVKFPKDIWLKREYAILLAKNNESEEAIKIYKNLVLELGDQSYVWHEFALLFSDENLDLAIGMLSMAIKLQKDENFLGTTRLDLADKLIKLNKLEKAKIELNTYQEYRLANSKNVSEQFNVLAVFVKEIEPQKKDNLDFYYDQILQAESFAYQDIKWSELVFIEKWKNDKNKEKLSFTDSNILNISISTNRFPQLKNIEVGQTIKFKLHNKLVEDKIKLHHFKQEYFPLLVEISDKPKWSSLEDCIAVVDYINIEKNIVHAISNDNMEIFFPMENLSLRKGDFIRAKKLQKKIREEIRIDLKDITKVNKEDVVNNFISHLAVIDSINVDKQLFHYVVNNRIHGIIKFDETQLRPQEGDFIQIRLVHKLDKKQNRIIFKAIEINTTEESTATLRKDISGLLKLKFKQYGSTVDWEDLYEEDEENLKPSFGFIGDYYVPKEIIEHSKIDRNCDVEAKVVFSGEKWKVYELNKKHIG